MIVICDYCNENVEKHGNDYLLINKNLKKCCNKCEKEGKHEQG